jgi:hypothetical protein
MSLSIGVEIEGVALRRATSSAPFPLNSDHQLRLIVDELERNNLPARVYVPSSTRGTGPNYSVWNVTIDATVSEVTSGSDTGPSAFRERFGLKSSPPSSTTLMPTILSGNSSYNGALNRLATRSHGRPIVVLVFIYMLDLVQRVANSLLTR